MDTVGGEFTVTIAEAVSAGHEPFETITEYVVFVVGETVIEEAVDELFQE